MSVLAHIVLNSDNVAPEPAATKAFAFILNSDHEAATRFVRRVCEELGLGPFELGRIAGQPHSDDGRPDLVIHDAEHRPRLVLEFKFRARLTENQPVGYLNLLPEEEQAALLFVVPEQRVEAVWTELRDVCADAGVNLVEEPDAQALTFARLGSRDSLHILAITSWEHVLDELLQGVGGADTRSDIVQLQGLTRQVTRRFMMPTTAFIVWWYGPYHGIDEFFENSPDGRQLYMAVSEGFPCRVVHVGVAEDPHERFNADAQDHDATFLQFAADGCGLYVGELIPTPAGPAGVAPAATQRAADALRCVLLDGPVPEGFVSLFSSFYEGKLDEALQEYPLATPLPGFPLSVAFNPYPQPANEGNWIIVRAPRFR